MKKIIVILGLLMYGLSSQAQSLTGGEYFFDTAPALGNGVSFSFTPADTIKQTLNIPVSSLTTGFHYLFIRVKNSAGTWSHYEGRLLYVIVPGAVTNQPSLSSGEWFVDNDPGFGKGHALTFSQSDTVKQVFNISSSGILPGFHNLFIRVKNTTGKWSLFEGRLFYVIPPGSIPNQPALASGEWFVDKDPGFGNGTAITFAQSDTVKPLISLNTTKFSNGFHYLFIRVKNTSGVWSQYEGRLFYVIPPGSIPNHPAIAAGEWFVDTDPGVGNGTAIKSFTQADTVKSIIDITTPDLSVGVHYLFIRVQNLSGNWSLYEGRPFNVCSKLDTVGISITASSNPACSGTSVTFTATTTNGGASPAYQWYKNSILQTGQTNTTYAVTPLDNDQVTCIITSIDICTTNNPATSNAIKMSVYGCYSISGYVKYDNKDSTVMTKTTVSLANSGDTIIGNNTTDVTGHYTFDNLNNGTYKLSCSTAKTWGGVNPVDALVVNRTYIQLSKLTDPLEKLAGDVNNDGKINPVDALTINRRYIELINKFTKPDWIFSNPTVIIDGSDITKNIIAICTGDVNASYIPPARITLSPLNTIGFMNISPNPSPSPINIPVYLNANTELGAIGIKLNVNNENLKIKGVSSEIEGLIYNITDKGVNIAWSADNEGYSITPDKPLFILTAIIDKSNNLMSNNPISISYETELADISANPISSDKLFMPELNINGQQSAAEMFNAYSNENLLIINYNNSENTQATLSILNILGQNVKDNFEISSGTYRMNLDVAPGAYLIRLVTNDKVYIKKVYLQ